MVKEGVAEQHMSRRWWSSVSIAALRVFPQCPSSATTPIPTSHRLSHVHIKRAHLALLIPLH